MTALPAAVVFDCDGTLVDSERVTSAAMREALAEQGHTLTRQDLATLVGHPWPHTRAHLVGRFGLTEEDVGRYRDRMAVLARPRFADEALVFADVAGVVGTLRAAGVPMAVCTSSGRDHLTRVLGLAPLRDTFAVTVTREDTPRHKPDPLPYRRAIELLAEHAGVPLAAADVTVVEDSLPGVTAAVAAGCWTVAVDRGGGLHDLSPAHVLVDRLDVDVLVPAR